MDVLADPPDRKPLREVAPMYAPRRSGGLQGSYQDRSSAFDTERIERERAAAASASVDTAEAPSPGRDRAGSPSHVSDRERSKAVEDSDEMDRVGLRYAEQGRDKPGR